MNTKTKQTTLAIGGAALILALAMGVASIPPDPRHIEKTESASESSYVMSGSRMLFTTTPVLEKLNMRHGQQVSTEQVFAVIQGNLRSAERELATMQANQDKTHALFRECANSVFSTAACRKAIAGVGQ